MPGAMSVSSSAPGKPRECLALGRGVLDDDRPVLPVRGEVTAPLDGTLRVQRGKVLGSGEVHPSPGEVREPTGVVGVEVSQDDVTDASAARRVSIERVIGPDDTVGVVLVTDPAQSGQILR